MKINFNEIQEVNSGIKPDIAGVKVKLGALPKLIKGEKGDRVELVFTDGKGTFKTNILDPWNINEEKYQSDENYQKIVGGNFGRLLHLFGSMVEDKAYQALKDISVESVEDYLKKASELYAKDLIETEFTIMIGYNKDGYLSFPSVGACISSKHKPKTLIWTDKAKLTLLPVAKATPDAEVDAPSDDEL